MKYLIKLNRLSAWILLIGMTLYFISGFGMTKGIISYKTAAYLHLDLLTIITLLVFTIHGAFSTRLALMRWKIWGGIFKLIWAIFFIAFLGSFIYIDKFYKKPSQTVSQSSSAAVISPTQALPNQSAAAASGSFNNSVQSGNQQTVFTASTLAKYNGQGGKSAFVAVDGVVYDLSSVFRNGTHQGFSAGADQSDAFHSHHYDGILSNFPVVGTYQP